jgi:hypothetical protein
LRAGAGVAIYTGTATEVSIEPGNTTAVTIFLQQASPPQPYQNTVPMITSFVASALSTTPGGRVTFTVHAVDPDPGDTLVYAWSATAGSFAETGSPSTVWTAPEGQGTFQVAASARDLHGAVATVAGSITVGPGGVGAAAVNITVNTSPAVVGLVPAPTRIGVGEQTRLDLTAVDPDGDSLSYTSVTNTVFAANANGVLLRSRSCVSVSLSS